MTTLTVFTTSMSSSREGSLSLELPFPLDELSLSLLTLEFSGDFDLGLERSSRAGPRAGASPKLRLAVGLVVESGGEGVVCLDGAHLFGGCGALCAF